jgi:hypothetical protein
VDGLFPSLFERYADAIHALPERDEFGKTDLLVPEFRLVKDKCLEIYYAPFDFINTQAKVAVVGITPGWTQMEIAFRQASAALRNGLTASEALQQAKAEASFAGSMRKNLVRMLDETPLQKALGLESCDSLFGNSKRFLHTTSAVRYPAFVRGRNYTGHSPELLSNPVLARYVEEVLAPELSSLPKALVVPLGKCVDAVLKRLVQVGALNAKRCLLGFPHPSGANGHRRVEFEQGRKAFTQIIESWASS